MNHPLGNYYSHPIAVPRDTLVEETVPFDLPIPRGDYMIRFQVIGNTPLTRMTDEGIVQEYHDQRGISLLGMKSL